MNDQFRIKCFLHSAKCHLDEEMREMGLAEFHRVKARKNREAHERAMRQAEELIKGLDQ